MHPQKNTFAATLRRTHRWLTAAMLCTGLFVGSPLVAQEAAKQTGAVEGRVFNAASGSYLNKARVTVEGTSIETFTSDTGDYRLRNVPVGPNRIRVRYTGQADLVETVDITSDATAKADFSFNAANVSADAKTIVLDKFVVEAQRFKNAQEIAINEERTSTNIKSVVALDSLGYVRDGNVGEFIKFLPGVDVENGGLGAGSNPDNATTVGVRGFGADSTQILVDGMPIASGSPNALTRAVQLDALSVNNASRLEIIKVPTPDMSTDAPGGTINLITRGAFELPKATYNVSVAFNGSSLTPDIFEKTPGPYEPSFKTRPSIRVNATIPLTKTLGVSFSAATDNKYSLTNTSNMRDWLYTGRNTSGSGTLVPVANAQGGIRIDNPLLERWEIVENQWIEQNNSGNLRFDWRPIPGLEIRVNGQLSTKEGTGLVRRTQWRYGTNTTGLFAVKDWGDGYITGYQRTATFVPNGLSGSMTADARDREGFTTQGYITAKYRKGPWAIDAAVTASESYTNTPDNKNRHFSSVDANLGVGRIDVSGISEGIVGRIDIWNATGAPVDYSSLSNWNTVLTTGFRGRSSQAANRDVNKEYKLDVSRELDFLPFPLTLKAGGKQVEKSNRKWGLGSAYERQYIGPNIANAEIESEYTSEAKFGYSTPQHWVDPRKIYELYEANPENWSDSLVSSALNYNGPAINYLSKVGSTKALTETATDYYGMATAKLFRNRMTIITGARQSRKAREGMNLYNNVNWNFVTNADGTRYRDSVYIQGVRFDGVDNTLYPIGDPRRPATAVMTDTALRARMQAAGVEYLPTKLELAPNGTALGNVNQNLFMAMRNRYTRRVDASLTQPWTPQVQIAYEITDTIRAQVAWSRETRIPDLEGTDTSLLVAGANFQITQSTATPTGTLGEDGTITMANINGKPEVNESINGKLSYYPKNGRGQYSISYYYKVVNNSWETVDVFNTDSLYETILGTMGLSSDDYQNYLIRTVDTRPFKQIRKGYEIDLRQNLGLFGAWGNGIDMFLTYTRRPVPARSPSTALGFVSQTPVRAKWTGGLSYSMRRFSIQGRFTFLEAGITHQSAINVALPDGTTQSVQFYNLNKVPPEVNLQANYVLNKNFTFFATANRVLTGRVTSQISDTQTGYLPDWASWRDSRERGIAFSAGVTASF